MGQDVLISSQATRRYDPAVILRAMAVDVLAVMIFVVVGRAFHDDGLTAGGLLTTAWPFLVGVVGGWLGIVLARLRPLSYGAAAMMLVKTVVLGVALRAVISDAPTPPSFVAMTVLVLGVLFFGWRFTSRRLSARRT